MEKSKLLILRTVYNRPEFLHFALESEYKAKKVENLKTVFIVDIDKYTPNQEVLDLLNKYPFDKEIIIQNKHRGSSNNVLFGYEYCFNNYDIDYLIVLEDDFIIHKNYFKFVDKVTNMYNSKDIVGISCWHDNKGSFPNLLYESKGNYCHLGGIMSKDFYMKYIKEHSVEYAKMEGGIPGYKRYVTMNIDEKYRDCKDYPYDMFKGARWVEQDGMIKRMSFVAYLKEKKPVIYSNCSWLAHIGFYGCNRRDFSLDNRDMNLQDKIGFIDNIIKQNAYNLYDRTYFDYFELSNELDNWDGELEKIKTVNVL